MRKKWNIVLTGFMGTGKSTIGKRLSCKLNMDFVDTDKRIEDMENMTISEIFAQKGEAEFRRIESAVIEEISKYSNCVIATGGGVVLNRTNMDNLRKNGMIVYLESNVDAIIRNVSGDTGRPLLKKSNLREHIMNMLEQRKNYYMNYDYKVDVSNVSVEKAVDMIAEIYKSV